jgi:multimeric flavodoxin WrbA
MKKIVVINGSPHEHGSTSVLADMVIEALRQQGAGVIAHFVNDMNIQGCQGCGQCKSLGRCVLLDDMQPLYDDISEADGIILATPVYMWQMSAQLKLPYDRLYAYLAPGHVSRLAPGKKVLLLATQGRQDLNFFRYYFEKMGEFLAFIGFGEHKILIAKGQRNPEELNSQADLVYEVRRMGAWLCE